MKLGRSLAYLALGLHFMTGFGSTTAQPLGNTSGFQASIHLRPISVTPVRDHKQVEARFLLVNSTPVEWLYLTGGTPVPMFCRLQVMDGGKWVPVHEPVAPPPNLFPIRLSPFGSNIVAVLLPADGLERRVGIALREVPNQLRGIRNAARVLQEMQNMKQQIVATIWSERGLKDSYLPDQGLLVAVQYQPMTFDPVQWKRGAPLAKVAMSDQLIQTQILVGKTRREVLQSLGLPASDRDRREKAEWFVAYRPQDIHFPVAQYLTVFFSPQQLAREVAITQSPFP